MNQASISPLRSEGDTAVKSTPQRVQPVSICVGRSPLESVFARRDDEAKEVIQEVMKMGGRSLSPMRPAKAVVEKTPALPPPPQFSFPPPQLPMQSPVRKVMAKSSPVRVETSPTRKKKAHKYDPGSLRAGLDAEIRLERLLSERLAAKENEIAALKAALL
eukprot:TRINITY_DN3267_c1_g2_i1.p1 TRINITY_DN3267_c1_g2~~TRINITY_DN3267_c1_g2_i1.p1  ORF type:complete len:161 (+),score=33.14 TRINITY_DN3267_c1_g2_i1:67-549(+)